jgi:hypothetical protein
MQPSPPKQKCRARRKNHEPCKNPPVAGKDLCRMHGGSVGSGGMHNLRHGRYSKSLGKLAAGYESSLNDRQLFDLREPIAALDGVTKRLMAMVDEHDSPEWRRAVRSKYKAVREALASGDPNAAAMLEELGELIEKGAAEAGSLESLGSNLDKLARRIEGAWSIHLQKTQVMNKGELVGLLAKFVAVVRDEAGSAIASRVQQQLYSLLSAPASQQIAEQSRPADVESEG